MARNFVSRLAQDLGSTVESISEAAIGKLMEYDWPGNVRQLENVIERSLVLCSRRILEASDIRLDDMPRKTSRPDRFLPEGMSLDDYEKQIIREALKRANGNKSQAARTRALADSDSRNPPH